MDCAKNLRFESCSVIYMYPSPRSLAVSLDNLLAQHQSNIALDAMASEQSLGKPTSYLGLSLVLVLISYKPNPIRVRLHLGG